MNTRSHLELARQRQAELRGERPPAMPVEWSWRGLLHSWRSIPVALSRARHRTGWALVEVGLRMAVSSASTEPTGERARRAA